MNINSVLKKRKGFTLAEILVTLGVIGVIASMTVPNLIQNTQDAQFRTAWKKTFAELSQATKMLLNDAGGDFTNFFSTHSLDETAANDMKNKYKSYLSFIKECSFNQAINQGCWAQPRFASNNSIYYLDSGSSSAVLNNGASIAFSLTKADCSGTNGTIGNFCGTIIVDVNGVKGPNKTGKDLFWAIVYKDRLRPRGAQGDSNEFDSDINNSAKYLYN